MQRGGRRAKSREGGGMERNGGEEKVGKDWGREGSGVERKDEWGEGSS